MEDKGEDIVLGVVLLTYFGYMAVLFVNSLCIGRGICL